MIESSKPIAQVTRDLGLNAGTLTNWMNAYRREHADEEPTLTIGERTRLKEQERIIRELRLENEFLKNPPRTLRKSSNEHET